MYKKTTQAVRDNEITLRITRDDLKHSSVFVLNVVFLSFYSLSVMMLYNFEQCIFKTKFHRDTKQVLYLGFQKSICKLCNLIFAVIMHEEFNWKYIFFTFDTLKLRFIFIHYSLS